MPIIHNTPSRTVISATANATYVIAGNNTVSNVGVAGQNVLSASITRVWWSTDSVVTIQRGSNTILTLRGNDDWNFKEAGISLGQDATANLVINCGTTANVSVIVEISKQGVVS